MAQIVFAPRAFGDFERIFEFYARDDPRLARAQVEAVREAISMLGQHPLVGRIVNDGLRELVISRGRTGFLALYRFDPSLDVVAVLAIRHQRELGYPQG